MRFESLIKEQLTRLNEADPNQDPELGGVPQTGAQNTQADISAQDPAQQQPQQQEPPPEEKPKPLTSEGARYLTELALKALAFNPDNLPDADKQIFTQDVTPENAQETLERIQQIVSGSGALSS